MLELWGSIGFLVFTVSATVFTLLYLTMSRWYKSFMGTLIAVFMLAMIILCDYVSLRIWDIELPGVEWVRLVIFWVLGLSMLSAVIGFLEIQFGKRARKVKDRLSQRYTDVNTNELIEEE